MGAGVLAADAVEALDDDLAGRLRVAVAQRRCARIATGSYVNRSCPASCCCAAFGSGHWAPPAGMLQVPVAAGSVPAVVAGVTVMDGGT
ncbi:hypothetical protein SGLAM104S_00360 [Streptomyces glaucescens]